MMQKVCLFWVVLSAVCLGQGGSVLVRNGDFNAEKFGGEVRTEWAPGMFALSQHTEDLSWNRCLKVELVKMAVTETGARRLNGNVMIGADGPRPGFPVKPSTLYHFSFEVRGTVPSASAAACFWTGDSTLTRDGLTPARTSLGGFLVTSEWTVLRGTFRTGADTRRAALNVKLWSDSAQVKDFRWENGQYLLIDNVQVQEKAAVGLAEAGDGAAPSAPPALALLVPAAEVDGFINFKTGKPADVDSRFSLRLEGDVLLLDVFCPSPAPVRAENRGDGSKVWSGDVVEVFFGPVEGARDRLLSQFVLGAGGGRYRGNGAGEMMEYDRWEAKPEVQTDGWRAEFAIPLRELGFSGMPVAGETIAFNVCRQRQGELSSWAPVRNGFHEVSEYGLLVFGTAQDYARRILAGLGEKPEALNAEWDEFAAGQAAIGDLVNLGRSLRRRHQELRFQQEPYVLGTMPVTGDFSLPLEPWVENLVLDNRKPMVVKAAVNERQALPLTITNRTRQAVAYRVLLHPGGNVYGLEAHGLGNDFPSAQVTLREAVAMKDDDGAQAGGRYDALVRMNQISTVTIAAGETGVVWVDFDCRGVAPGEYPGAIRVIPLQGEGGFAKGTTKYRGQARDFPLQLTVLPITLSTRPALPAWLMGRGDTEDLFLMQAELGGRLLMINPWSLKFKFNDQGELVDGDLPEVAAALRTRLEWYRKHGLEGGPRFIVGFSAYSVFAKQYLPKTIKEMTPEWRLAWKNNLLAMEKLLRENGVDQDDYAIEVFDEPNGKDLDRDLEVCRIARETLPEARLSITWAAANFGHTPDTIRRFLPYINDHCIWGGHLSNPAYRELARDLRSMPGQHYGIYSCSTSLREDLYRYYRLHAWRALEFDAGVVGLYIFCDAPHGTAGATNWKGKANGGITYRSGDESIPSIRSEAFRQGMTDLAYLDVLRRLAGGDSADAVAARDFLAAAPAEVVVKKSHDRGVAEQMRHQAIDFILKLQNKK
jgi:hypothetical protein